MTRWLKAVRAANGLDQLDLAEELKVSRSTVGMWETGSPVPEQFVKKMIELYPDGPKPPDGPDVDKPFEVSDPGFPVSFPKVTMRYAGLVPASENWGDPLSSDLPWEVDAKFDHPKRFVCRVTGLSCFPALQQGDVTIWHVDPAPPVGKIVIAQRKGDHGCTVKELGQEAGGRNTLIPINKDSEPPPDGDGWGVIAMLVGIEYEEEDGTEMSLYRPKGISPKLLTKLRS